MKRNLAWSTGIWQHQSTELHDTGCRKSSVSRSSQEQSLYSSPICARLWKKDKAKTHNIVVGLLLHKPWVMVPFWNTINPTSFSYQSHPRWNLNGCKSGQERIGLLCNREVCVRKSPWQGLARSQIIYIKIKSRLEKKISLHSSNNAKTGERPHQVEDDEQHGTVEDGVSEFDSSSDEETCTGEAFVEEESDSGNQQFTWDVDFLMGTTSRFGRSVRLNSRFNF